MEHLTMSLRPTALDRVAPEMARSERAALAFRGSEEDRMAWPRAALVVGGVSLVLWAAILHLAFHLLG